MVPDVIELAGRLANGEEVDLRQLGSALRKAVLENRADAAKDLAGVGGEGPVFEVLAGALEEPVTRSGVLRSRVLEVLAAGPATPSALAATLGSDKFQTSRALRQLVAAGLIELEPPSITSDRRTRVYRLVSAAGS